MIENKRNILDYSLFISSGLLIFICILQYNIKSEGYMLVTPLNWLYGIIISGIIGFGVYGALKRGDNLFFNISASLFLLVAMFFAEFFSSYILLLVVILVAVILLTIKGKYNKIVRVITMICSVTFVVVTLLFSLTQFVFQSVQDGNVIAQYFSDDASQVATVVVYDEEQTSVFLNDVLEDKSLGMFGDLKSRGYGRTVSEYPGVNVPNVVFDGNGELIIEWEE